jgi:hypothetical protein
MLEREDFNKRWENEVPIALHELLYPLAQGYDSVALKADVELGSSDQLFNLLVGRQLQKEYGQPPQVCLTGPLLEGIDAREVEGKIVGDKMSKSLGNYVGITEPAQEQYGKLMSISDGLMWRYYELLSRRSLAEVEALRRLHPRPAVLQPPDSTVGAVVRALDGVALAHLACHGRLRSDNPAFSSLLLSDGSLTVHELYLRSIAPRLMVLASCDSAADVTYEGDELLGFVSALFARGTAGLVASPILVPDTEAVDLMRRLHEGILGGATLAVALHAARAALDRDDPAAFVNWCAFTAFGAG